VKIDVTKRDLKSAGTFGARNEKKPVVRTARTAVILAAAAGVLWIAALFGLLSAV